MEYIKFTVDGKSVSIPKGGTILQGCEVAGVTVPRFCYHERLSIAGNCRMCLVEVEKSPKLVASCAMSASNGMVVHTNTAVVRKAREGIIELLLINHPLDCPICDQGGECDLQDQAMQYGSDRNRYTEYKRAVADKDLGPIVKTVMTRCIQCTRCIRFATEIAGVPTLGTTGRGNQLEIGTYIEKLLSTELSGNVVDICPVGALTNKPYAFKVRSWELTSCESIDILDPLCSNIRIDSRGGSIFRILPALNDDVNGCWISDKTRFAYEGWARQRTGLQSSDWKSAIETAAASLTNISKFNIGSLIDLDSAVGLRKLLNVLGIRNATTAAFASSSDIRNLYLLEPQLHTSDVIVAIGCNPRIQSPVFNALWLRQAYQQGKLRVYNLTTSYKPNLSYESEGAGITYHSLSKLIAGKHPLARTILKANKPYIMDSVANSSQSTDSYEHKNALTPLLHTLASLSRETSRKGAYKTKKRIGAFHINFGHFAASVGALSTAEVGINSNAQSHGIANILISNQNSEKLIIDHHTDFSTSTTSTTTQILPTTVESEKIASYINILGNVQKTQKASSNVAKRDTAHIITALHTLINAYPTNIDYSELGVSTQLELSSSRHVASVLSSTRNTNVRCLYSRVLLDAPVKSYLQNDPISNASPVLAQASGMQEKEVLFS